MKTLTQEIIDGGSPLRGEWRVKDRIVVHGTLDVDDGGRLLVDYGGTLDVHSGATLAVYDDVTIDVYNGGRLVVDDGGTLVVYGSPVGIINVENLKIIAPLALADGALKMSEVHNCDTTHCMSGWACHALPGGRELEEKYGWYMSGLILLGTESASHFYDSDADAKAFLSKFVK